VRNVEPFMCALAVHSSTLHCRLIHRCSSALTCSPLIDNPAVWAKLVHEIVCLITPKPGEEPSANSFVAANHTVLPSGQALKAGAEAEFHVPSVDTPDDIVAGKTDDQALRHATC
jgi:hypothetical protein